jgi:putative ABC transport system ATP-binding protein
MSTIELRNISKVYGKGASCVTAVSDVNFEANAGEVVLLEGPSGAGKSTLLTIMGALQSPTSGQVLIDGQEINDFSEKKRARLRLEKIGFVLQAYNLVPYLTVEKQFTLVDKVKKEGNLSKGQLKELLADLDITDLVKKYPSELSGGQQQRAAIARALYANPSILLADEPTAALDSGRVAQVGKLFQHLAQSQNKAIILVTHDARLEKYSQHIYKMLDGQLSQAK